jgi:hypothetical protein
MDHTNGGAPEKVGRSPTGRSRRAAALLISDAEIAFNAFTGRRKSKQVIARLNVRVVRRRNPTTVAGQSEMFVVTATTRFFTDGGDRCSPRAEATRRDHAMI